MLFVENIIIRRFPNEPLQSAYSYLSTRTLYQPDFKQKRQIIPDTGSRPAGIICRSLYAH